MERDSSPTPSFGTTVEIITWMLLVVSLFATLARLLTKWAMIKRFDWDDIACMLSLVLNIGTGASISIMAQSTLETDVTNKSKPVSVDTFLKSMYAMETLYIGTLCFAKLSIILLLRAISPNQRHQRLSLALGTFILGWGLLSLIVALFQCAPPNLWQTMSGSCYDRSAFWRAVGVINIITDVFLIALPCVMVLALQMAWRKKMAVLACFCARGFDIVATICQLVYTGELKSTSITSEIWPWIICAQAIQTISIITSCIPYLRPLLESFPSGMMVNDDATRYETTFSSNPPKHVSGYNKQPSCDYIMHDLSEASSNERGTLVTCNKTRNPESPSLTNSLSNLTGQPYQHTSHIAWSPPTIFPQDGQSDLISGESRGNVIQAVTTVETVWQNSAGIETK